MRIRRFILLPLLSVFAVTGANAGWQYPGEYVGDGWYIDDGSRFTLSFRGGGSLGMATIKNDIGALTNEYYYNPTTGELITAAEYDNCGDVCAGIFDSAGIANMADLPATKDFSHFSFAAGVSLGWIVSGFPQWRVEVGWDQITESEYNVSPLFDGDLALTGGNIDGIVLHLQSGSVQSKVTTDIISAMAFYDFFEGDQKPLRQAIPYVGFGIGYSNSKTVMNLSDLYGDLSTSIDLRNFGEPDEFGIIQFYRSETHTSNVAGLVAVGLSYGINERMFIDVGARLAYIPRIKWALQNADGSRERDWFSAENMIYTNFMVGMRFEF